MDRFIAVFSTCTVTQFTDLKSNMDRFIADLQDKYAGMSDVFKIQYG